MFYWGYIFIIESATLSYLIRGNLQKLLYLVIYLSICESISSLSVILGHITVDVIYNSCIIVRHTIFYTSIYNRNKDVMGGNYV